MSLRVKLAVTVLIALVVNIFALILCYNLFISTRLSRNFSERQAELDTNVQKISHQVDGHPDYRDYLSALSKKDGYSIQLQSLNGDTVFDQKASKGASLFINSTGIVHFSGDTYILKVVKPLSIENAYTIPFVHTLLEVEIGILSVILLFISILLYLQYVKPIEKLQKSIRNYKKGEMPEASRRMDEIGKLQNSFVQLANDLREEKQKQNRIIASISHDIKTPLTSVMGYAELLKTGKLSEERKTRYVDTIYEKSDAIKALIGEFDDYLSYNLQPSFHKQKVSADELCQLLKEDYKEELESAGIQFKIIDVCEKASIIADLSKLRRIFGNIIGNSIKHFGNIQNPAILVICSQVKNTMRFQISDNGTGIPNEILSHIFESFFTSDDGRKVAGLGLSICKEIVEAHEGRIWAENNKGGGLSIYFEITITLG